MSFSPIISGSVREGTKIKYPNEFDFLVCLDNFQNKIEIIENENMPASYCTVELKTHFKHGDIAKLFDTNGQLNTCKLAMKIYNIIYDVLSDSEIWQDLGFYWNSGPTHDSETISALELYWVGPYYKLLPISVDIVLAVSMRNWWPTTGNSNRNLITNDMKKDGCLLIMKRKVDFDESCYFRISFSKAETNIIRNTTDIVRKGYMLAKAIRTWVPRCVVHIDDDEEVDNVDAEFLFSSYVLNTSLLKELEEGAILEDSSSPNGNEYLFQNKELSTVIGVAYRIWKRVETAVLLGHLPSFFIENYAVYEKEDTDNIVSLQGYPNEHAKVLSHMITEVLKKFA